MLHIDDKYRVCSMYQLLTKTKFNEFARSWLENKSSMLELFVTYLQPNKFFKFPM